MNVCLTFEIAGKEDLSFIIKHVIPMIRVLIIVVVIYKIHQYIIQFEYQYERTSPL